MALTRPLFDAARIFFRVAWKPFFVRRSGPPYRTSGMRNTATPFAATRPVRPPSPAKISPSTTPSNDDSVRMGGVRAGGIWEWWLWWLCAGGALDPWRVCGEIVDCGVEVQGPVGYEVWGLVVGPSGKKRWGDWLDDLVTRTFPAAWRRSLPVGGDFVGWLVWSSVLVNGGEPLLERG